MITRILPFFVLLSFSVDAKLYEIEVEGIKDKLGKSTQGNIEVVLVDVGNKDLISGLVTITKKFKEVESAILVIYDGDDKIGRVILGVQENKENGIDPSYEFNLSRRLLKNSVVLISLRKKDDLYIYKVRLRKFDIIDKMER